MTYKILTKVHYEDVNEWWKAPVLPALQVAQRQLQTDIAALNVARQASVVPHGANQVTRIKAMHEGLARQNQIQELERAIERTQKTITRLGGVSDAHGNVRQVEGDNLVVYDLTLQKQGLTKVQVVAGLLYHASGDKLDTGALQNYLGQAGVAIYVLSAQGNLHVSNQEYQKRHHSSLLAGIPIASAGEIVVKDGKVTYISNSSGHYLPALDHFLQVLHHLQKRTVDLNATRIAYVWGIYPHERRISTGIRNFLTDNALDDDSYDWNNLLYAYKTLLNDRVLGPKGWEYRPNAAKPGVYKIGTPEMVPYRDVRHFLKGQGTAITQDTGNTDLVRPNPS